MSITSDDDLTGLLGWIRRERPENTLQPTFWQAALLMNVAFLHLHADGTLATAHDRAFLLKTACVVRDWIFARAWLRDWLKPTEVP